MTARSMGLSVEPIGPEWLLPPEHSSAEREIDHLSKEIEQLRKQEPQFLIRCTDYDGNEVHELNLVNKIHKPLTDDEISSCIAMLKSRFPIATDFNRRRAKPSLPVAYELAGVRWHFKPASKEEIDKYQGIDYPEWIEECRRVLMSIHETLQKREGQLSFTIEMENVGSRPADDALVVFRAKGNFRICPPPLEEDDTGDCEQTEISLPCPPEPPRGRWESTRLRFNRGLASSLLGGLPGLNPSLLGGLSGLNLSSMEGFPFTHEPYRRDPNKFYYKQGRQTEPSDSFSLECEQWRHGTVWEVFHGDIFPREGVGDSTGVLECEIHAGNLSQPKLMKIHVKINVREVSSKDFANRLVNPPPKELFRR